jgi:hypothetical protein
MSFDEFAFGKLDFGIDTKRPWDCNFAASSVRFNPSARCKSIFDAAFNEKKFSFSLFLLHTYVAAKSRPYVRSNICTFEV